MNTSAIHKLREFMSQEASEDAEVRKQNFDRIFTVLKEIGVSENSALHNYLTAMIEKDGSVTEENYESARGYLRGAVEKCLEIQYMRAFDVSADVYYGKKVSMSDRNAIRGLLLYMAVNGDGADLFDSKGINELLAVQRGLLRHETGSMTQLRIASNELINEILSDPLAVGGKEKVERVKKAFAVFTDDSIIPILGIDRVIEQAKRGTLVSVSAIRSVLAAA
jgi:hypothetical protein